MSNLRYYILLLIASVVVPANAYELGTHGRLTFEAYNRSVVKADSSLLGELGVQGISNPFGTTYYDMAGDEVRSRAKHDFEQSAGRMPEEVDPLSIVGWLLRGAIREDDLGFLFSVFRFQYGDDPHDDPYGSFWRVTQHFYDPVNDRPLTLSLPCLKAFVDATQDDGNFKAAPSWGLGVQDAFSEPNTPDVRRRNHFSVLDAREAMYRALTGRNNQNEVKASTAGERDKYWATTFRALGDVVHLIQDVAQPQHTRNDPHGGAFCFGGKSGYEKYIEARATGDSSHNIDKSITTFPPLAYEGYALPRFTRYSDFFSTAPRDSVESGLGLADYSNRGFFSAGTNLGENDYPLPPNDRNHYIEQTVSVDGDARTSYLLDTVFDRLNPALREFDVPKTKESLWYDPLVEFAGPGIAETFGYTLDQRIYDAQANLLIPRAVAYSAGLIDYFFRGRLEAVDPTFTDEGVSLKVKNAIDRNQISEWANESLYVQKDQGYFVVTVTYKEGNEERLVASDPVNFTTQEFIKPGETADEILSFKLSALPDNATDIEYRLVFRGRLGQEDDAIGVGSVGVGSGFVIQPNYVPDDGIQGKRLIVKNGSRWQLTKDRGPEAGNVDWKGWYVNGKPTKVLSWWGPAGRYFPGRFFSTFTNNIYQDGERFAVAPFPVLGAAITKDAEGKEWLVTIVHSGATELVYRRPNIKSSSSARFDPDSRPDGWRFMGTYVAPAGETPSMPWFFNGEGSVTQTMRVSERSIFGTKTTRVRTMLSDSRKMFLEQAQFDELGNLQGITFKTDSSCSNELNQHSQTTRKGSYVMAVDYKDMNEVLLLFEEDTEKLQNASRDRVNPNDRSTWPSQGFAEFHGSAIENVYLSFDQVRITLRKNDSSTDQRLDETVNENGILRTTISSSSTSSQMTGELTYVDLRHRFYSVREVVVSNQTSGNLSSISVPGRKPIVSGSISRTDTTSSYVQYDSQRIPIFSHSQTISGEVTSVPQPSRADCTNSQGVSIPPPTFFSLLQSPGAVDSSGNLVFSLQDGPFNYLTGGDLEQLIPTAPNNARYFPVGLVK